MSNKESLMHQKSYFLIVDYDIFADFFMVRLSCSQIDNIY